MYNNTTHLTVGVLLVDSSVQMADIAAADILGSVSTEYMAVLPKAAPLAALATPMTFVYISEDGASPLAITGDAKIVITTLQHSIQSAPKLDILIVPGPPPNYRAPETVKSFIKSTNESGGHVLVVFCVSATTGQGLVTHVMCDMYILSRFHSRNLPFAAAYPCLSVSSALIRASFVLSYQQVMSPELL